MMQTDDFVVSEQENSISATREKRKMSCGHEIMIKSLLQNNASLRTRIRLLLKRLEKQQICRSCTEMRSERNFFVRKCKKYKRQLERLGNRDGTPGFPHFKQLDEPLQESSKAPSGPHSKDHTCKKYDMQPKTQGQMPLVTCEIPQPELIHSQRNGWTEVGSIIPFVETQETQIKGTVSEIDISNIKQEPGIQPEDIYYQESSVRCEAPSCQKIHDESIDSFIEFEAIIPKVEPEKCIWDGLENEINMSVIKQEPETESSDTSCDDQDWINEHFDSCPDDVTQELAVNQHVVSNNQLEKATAKKHKSLLPAKRALTGEIVMTSEVELLLYKKKIILLMMMLRKREENCKLQRRWAVNPMRKKRAELQYNNTLMTEMDCEYDNENLKQFNRMSPRQFDMLTDLIRPYIAKKYSGDNLDVTQKLSIAIRFLATGDSYMSISHAFRVGVTTVHHIVKEVCAVLWDVLQPIYLPAPTSEIWKESAEGYGKIWNFPLCCGAVDGKHIIVQQPAKPESGVKPVVLLSVVGPNCKFIMVDIGTYCFNDCDGGIWKNSKLGQALENGELGLPEKRTLPGTNIIVPHVLLGDDTFQLRPGFLRPYSARGVDAKQRVFNYRLSRARKCSESAFGILASRWRVFLRPLMLNVANSEQVVKAAIVLHNFLMTDNAEEDNIYCPPGYADYPDETGKIIPGSWREDNFESAALQPVFKSFARHYTHEASDVRNIFSDYFVSEGNFDFQWTDVGIKH